MRNGHEEARVLLTVGPLTERLTGRRRDAPAVSGVPKGVVPTHASLAARWSAR
jgi:hypothetical protein